MQPASRTWPSRVATTLSVRYRARVGIVDQRRGRIENCGSRRRDIGWIGCEPCFGPSPRAAAQPPASSPAAAPRAVRSGPRFDRLRTQSIICHSTGRGADHRRLGRQAVPDEFRFCWIWMNRVPAAQTGGSTSDVPSPACRSGTRDPRARRSRPALLRECQRMGLGSAPRRSARGGRDLQQLGSSAPRRRPTSRRPDQQRPLTCNSATTACSTNAGSPAGAESPASGPRLKCLCRSGRRRPAPSAESTVRSARAGNAPHP